MGLFSGLRGEFIDIIEWIDESNNTIVYRFERYDNEIKNNAKLVVRESQMAVFIDQGKFADVFLPGTHTLITENLPILSTLKGWKHGFDSPFKSEVYFISTKRFTDLGWGTPEPVIIRDPELGPIRVRAFGNYSFKVKDATLFIKEIAGTDGSFMVDEVENQLRNYIVTGFTDAMAESKIPVIDFSSKYDEISAFGNEKLKPKFENYGLALMDLMIESISFPEEIQAMFDKRSSMNLMGNLNDYSKFQAAQAMEAAAKNPGGGAAEGIGMGMGMGMAQNMIQNMNQPQNQQQQTGPPPIPTVEKFFYAEDGQQKGPFSLPEIKILIDNKTFDKSTLVWKEGMAAWTIAEKVSSIAALFGATPPPLPS